MKPVDVLVAGGGIVGVATAHAVQARFPDARVVVLEKEPQLAAHQTGRNSGVIHSGIYYKPGSFKARFCKAGNASMVAFCREHCIDARICGKVIVATHPGELPGLDHLYQRGLEHGLDVQRLDAGGLRAVEPEVRGIAAVRVAAAGIVDYRVVVAKLADLVRARGGDVRLNSRVLGAAPGVVRTSAGDIAARVFINCCGLHSDRVARASGARVDVRIVPFRGEYYLLRPDRAHLVKALVYPVPDPLFPFLGVHCTRMIDGSVHLGPNAVLALAREGYTKTTIRLGDVLDVLGFPGFWRLARRHWRYSVDEVLRSFSRRRFLRSLQQLVPSIREEDLLPCSAGVRAQALRPTGDLEDDFLIVEAPGAIHVCNAPSPAATASLEIGRHVASLVRI
jgi:L-2-hydroxyglutarate oxidase